MSRQPKMPLPPKAADHPELIETPVMDLTGTPELDVASEEMPKAKPAPVMKKKIKVVANRAGFIHQERKAAGDKFEVHEHELGSWMDCEDKVEQQKHEARMKAKKARANRASEDDDADE